MSVEKAVERIRNHSERAVAHIERIIREECSAVEGEWVSVEERLPEREGRYLISYRVGGTPFRKIFVGDFLPDSGWSCFIGDDRVEYWRELPKPPAPPTPQAQPQEEASK